MRAPSDIVFMRHSISVYTFRRSKSRHSGDPLTTASSKYGLFIPLYASTLINLNDKFLFGVDINIIFDFGALCIIRVKAFGLDTKNSRFSLSWEVKFFVPGTFSSNLHIYSKITFDKK